MFSGRSPLCIRKKIWSPLAYGEIFWSPPLVPRKNSGPPKVKEHPLTQPIAVKVQKNCGKKFWPPSLTLKKLWPPYPLAHWKKLSPPFDHPKKFWYPTQTDAPLVLPVKNDSSLILWKYPHRLNFGTTCKCTEILFIWLVTSSHASLPMLACNMHL